MPAKALREQVKRLNTPSHASPLAPIWEVAILNALSKIVQIEHEPNLLSKPDIVYRFHGETVIADVRAISDSERHRRNQVDELNDEFQRRIAPLIQHGLKGGFCLSIGPKEWGMQKRDAPAIESIGPKEGRMQERDAPAIELQIPPVERFASVIFTSAFDDFVRALQSSPGERHTYSVDNPECRLIFSFSPESAGWTLDKYRYTQSTILNFNPVWSALYRKAEQLEKVTISGHRGIILCDGDCDTLREQSTWDHYGADEIIGKFIRESKVVEFVLTLAPFHDQQRRDLQSDSHSYLARLIYRDARFPDWLIPIRDLVSKLPQVRQTALNARYEAEWKRETKQWRQGSTFRGGCTVSENRIKLSARDVLEFLAGTLKQEQFQALPFMARENPFLDKLMHGQLITAVRIEKGEAEADDDWAVFEFGGPDPAVSPFRIPPVVNNSGK